MHRMAALEYSFLVAELAPRIAGRHFGRMRKLGDGIYRMKIGTTEILCELGVRIHETRYVEEAAGGDKFAEKAVKELDNSRLLSVEQLNNDRIISFVFDRGQLVFEMFGNGNAILVRDGTTVCAVKYEKWSGRETAAGKPYSPPPPAMPHSAPPPALPHSTQPPAMPAAISQVLPSSESPAKPPAIPSAKPETSDKYIISSLMKLPFGKDYAIEALARAGIGEKTPGNEIPGDKLAMLESELGKIRSSAKPFVFYDDNKPADFALAQLVKYQKLEARSFASLSEAADEYYSHVEKPNPEVEKLVRRLEKQQERLLELAQEEKADREKGDFIYAHYQEVELLLALAKEGKFDELGKFQAQAANVKAGKMNKKEKSVEVEIQ
jgi:predicted ribosome quality control (RQC) complex YloA/Tae2 family protein